MKLDTLTSKDRSSCSWKFYHDPKNWLAFCHAWIYWFLPSAMWDLVHVTFSPFLYQWNCRWTLHRTSARCPFSRIFPQPRALLTAAHVGPWPELNLGQRKRGRSFWSGAWNRVNPFVFISQRVCLVDRTGEREDCLRKGHRKAQSWHRDVSFSTYSWFQTALKLVNCAPVPGDPGTLQRPQSDCTF